MTNYEKMFKQLFVLGNGGVYLELADGHTWISYDENAEHSIEVILRNNGIAVNNKIYGGIAEALDTMDEALQKAGQPSLVQQYDELVQDFYFIGKGGAGSNRIEKVNPLHGGIF